MGVRSVLQTALSGLSASRLGVGVIANNLANSRTAGFKQSQHTQTAQALQTGGLDAAPHHAAGPNSRLPSKGDLARDGAASHVAKAAELSNTDVGKNLIDLKMSADQFRADLQVMSVSEELFSNSLLIRRSR